MIGPDRGFVSRELAKPRERDRESHDDESDAEWRRKPLRNDGDRPHALKRETQDDETDVDERWRKPDAGMILAHALLITQRGTIGAGTVKLVSDLRGLTSIWGRTNMELSRCFCPLGLAHFAHLKWPTLSY